MKQIQRNMHRALLLFLAEIIVMSAYSVEVGQTYRIRSVKFPSKSLFVKDSQCEAQADVVLWTETDVPSQQWRLLDGVNGAFVMQNVFTGIYAAPKAQTVGSTFRTDGTPRNGRVNIEVVDEVAGICRIKPVGKELCLGVTAGEDGLLPAWQNADAEDDGQRWVFEMVTPKETFTSAMRDEMMDDYLREHLHNKGSNYRTFYNGSWGEAEQLEVLLDAYEATGYERYLTAAEQVYAYFNQKVGSDWTKGGTNDYGWYGYDFNDDVMWQIIAVARLGWLTGNKAYTRVAKTNFDRIYKRAYIPFTGMLRWAERSGDPYSTNSCIEGPTEVAACYLGMSGCGEEYFEKARDIYAAQRKYLAQNMQTGKVWDNVVWDPETKDVKSKNEWASTYNQGTMLGAACLLYMHYGDAQYLRDARKIMIYTKSSLCNSNGIVNVCQDETNQDLCGFKGILMRYVRRFVLDLCQPSYQTWMLNNALMAYCNRSEQGVTGTGWLKKATPESTTNPFACSTAASAAVNAPLGDVVKPGLDTLQAEHFDYHCGLIVKEEAGRGGNRIIQVAGEYWAKYCNIDFSTDTARCITIDVAPSTDAVTGTIEIYFDQMDGTPAGICELENLKTSQTLEANITPTTGQHHMFLRFTYNNSGVKAYSIDQFCFHSHQAGESPTILRNLSAENPATDVYYTLSGIRLPSPPSIGTYVVRHAGKASIVCGNTQ